MTAVDDTPRAPLLANIVVLLGFAAVFASFAVDAAAAWILGVLMIVAGGIWAGFAGAGRDHDEPATSGGQSHGGAH